MTKAYYICGTHWDREWYEPFQEYRLWLVQNLDDILDRMKNDDRYRVFHLDGQAVLIEDYLQIRPERRADLCALLSTGRLVAGPWYAMPDLWLVSGEALIRNLTRGMRVIREHGSTPMPVGYTPDLFGHISSMPMIFTGVGLTSGIVWRGLNDDQVRAQFIWVGPDGSRLLMHKLPDHAGYGWFGAQIRWPWTNGDFDHAFLRDQAPAIMAAHVAQSDTPLLYLSDASDHQKLPQRVPEMLEQLHEVCPEIEFIHGSMMDYFAELAKYVDQLKEFHGELRYVARKTGNLYHALIPHCLSSHYPLKQANDRCQNILTLWAEPLAACALAAGKPIAPGFLDEAWKHLQHNQPHDSIGGCSIDETHADMPYRFHQAELLGDGVRRQAMAQLTTVSAKIQDASSVTVWNSLPWERRMVAELDLLFTADFPAKGMRSGHNGPILNQFDLLDFNGNEVAYQVLGVNSNRTVKLPNEQGRRQVVGDKLDVYRVAVEMDLPALGFTGYTVRPLEGVGRIKRQLGSLRTGPLTAKNEYLQVTVSAAGTVEIEHLATGRVYCDLFQYEDGGDTGDGWNYVQPICNSMLVSPGQSVSTFVEENGPLQVTFRIERVLRLPAALEPVDRESRQTSVVELHITDYLTLRKSDSMLHVKTIVNNTARDHRLRVLLPTDIAANEYWSDQPFAWVQRPIATDPRSDQYKEPDPVERPHHTIFAVGDATAGLAVLCPEGLHEHSVYDDARRTLALTLFRSVHKTPTTNGQPGPQVQGLMEFEYTLLPFAGELPRGLLLRKLLELQAPHYCHLTPSAPHRQSFLRVESSDDVVVTTIKPSMDGRSIIVRFWNTSGTEPNATIHLAWPCDSAWLCNLNEVDSEEIPLTAKDISVRVPARGLTTVRLGVANVPARNRT